MSAYRNYQLSVDNNSIKPSPPAPPSYPSSVASSTPPVYQYQQQLPPQQPISSYAYHSSSPYNPSLFPAHGGNPPASSSSLATAAASSSAYHSQQYPTQNVTHATDRVRTVSTSSVDLILDHDTTSYDVRLSPEKNVALRPQRPSAISDDDIIVMEMVPSNQERNMKEAKHAAADAEGDGGAIHPNRQKMKNDRRSATAMAMVGGAVVGSVVFPIVGTVVGGAAAGYAANKLSKTGERRAQRQWEQNNYQRHAARSAVAGAAYV